MTTLESVKKASRCHKKLTGLKNDLTGIKNILITLNTKMDGILKHYQTQNNSNNNGTAETDINRDQSRSLR